MADICTTSDLAQGDRSLVIGPAGGPEPPFPLHLSGVVVKGFGRGSKELGMPTANIPIGTKEETRWISGITSGVYFGWCSLRFPHNHSALTSSSHTPSSRILPPDYTPPAPAVQLSPECILDRWRLYPMVMSIGFNPFYNNDVRSAEVHVLNGFDEDFYGSQIRVCLLGFVREEKNYSSLEKLIEDIKIDCEVTRQSLARSNWDLTGEKWSREVEWLGGKETIEI
ncbi:hypothetical protein K3495_g7976 [Podosphaera aphanis]|nr:hypothetical protein K3495_g7976 [Podosphaera aphanis]